jgi:hypothetical protein
MPTASTDRMPQTRTQTTGAIAMTSTARTTPDTDHIAPTRRRATSRRTLSAAALIPLSLVLAACGAANATTSTSSSAAAGSGQNAAPAGNPGGGQGGAGFPGASGLIAAASKDTLQVQSATAQTTVTYAASTKFSKVVPGTIAVGDCVTVSGTPATGSTSALTATTVRIQAKVNGACPAFGGNGRGGFGGGNGGGSGAPGSTGANPQSSGAPSGGTRPAGSFANATGSVTSVTGSTVVVNGVLREGRPAAGAAAPTAAPITVTLASTTTVTTTVAATSAAAVVGQCASALGTANTQGAIAATSITISTPGANGCRTGFGRFGGGSGSGA